MNSNMDEQKNVTNINQNNNESNQKVSSFIEYTKLREQFGLNRRRINNSSRQLEYLQQKHEEINKKVTEYRRKGDLRYLTKNNSENSLNDRKYQAPIIQKTLSNGLIVGYGYNFTREYLEHKDLTKERNNYSYSYSSQTESVKNKRREYEELRQKEKKMNEKEVFLTKEGYEKLEQELRYLKTVERDEIGERIKVAKSYGDLSENGEYDEAKSAQEANETKIQELEYMLKVAKIIEEGQLNTDTVTVGSTVYITNITTNKEQKYTIVGVAESNILQGKISNESPTAKSLLGSKVGDIVQVEAPAGIIEYKVKKITLE